MNNNAANNDDDAASYEEVPVEQETRFPPSSQDNRGFTMDIAAVTSDNLHVILNNRLSASNPAL